MAFASLTIDLNARIANIEQDMGRVAHMMERRAKDIGDAFAKVTGILGLLGGGAGFVAFVKSNIDAADAMKDMATATGTSVESLASYQLAAQQSGTNVEDLARGLGKLSLYMAKNGEDAAALGITARDPVVAFSQLADALEKTTDPARRNELAFQVLGKSYATLMPLLAQGGQALREQAAAAAPYAQSMAKMADSSDQFNDALAAVQVQGSVALLPLIQWLGDTATAANEAAQGFSGMDAALVGLGQAGTIGQTLAVLWANVSYVFKEVGTEVGGIAAQLASLAGGDFKGAAKIGDMMKADAIRARAELDALEKRILEFKVNIAKPLAKANTGGSLADSILTAEEAKKIQDTLAKAFDLKALDDYVKSFKEKAAAIRGEYAKMRAEFNVGPAPENPTSSDITLAAWQARDAATRGDSAGAQAYAERAKSLLKTSAQQGAPGFEVSYLSRELEAMELELNKLQEKTAIAARDSFSAGLESMREAVAKMDPIRIPLAVDSIMQSIREDMDQFRKDLASNPLQIPVELTGSGNSELTRAVLKLGAR